MRFSADCAPRGKRRSAHYTSYSVAATAFLCLIPLSVAAQGSLEGTIRHAGTGAALSGAQVGLAELSLGGTTGPDGRYEVGDIPAGIHTIHIQLIGYANEVREVSVADGRTTHLDMELHETAVALEGLVAVGSRARPRTVTQSSVPIDAISSQDFIDQGDTDVNDLLRTVIPSFNVNPQATGDAAKIVRPASLRGLAPDHTLVLVNGKRRHRAAVITWIGGGFADGAQGPDLSSIPAIALRQVEVLRDGASAQYGSDAIAGVVKRSGMRSGGRVEAERAPSGRGRRSLHRRRKHRPAPGRSRFRQPERRIRRVEPHQPHRPARRRGRAHRRRQHSRWEPRIWGAPTIGCGPFAASSAGQIQRRIQRLPGRCPRCATGNSTARPTAPWWELGPGPRGAGRVNYVPRGLHTAVRGRRSDASVVAGLRGHTHGGLLWDFSGSFGQNAVDFFIDNTVNASLGPQSPASFDPGIYMQREIGANLDLNYTVNDMVNVAGGAEFRDEYFEIGIGETASWEIGSFAPQGFSAGSNGFPGFSDIAAGGWHRVNYAVYGDVELRGHEDRWTVGTALRTERFEDFGTTANWKVAARHTLTDVLAVRASTSTGFRAPTPGQQNAFNVSTQFDRTLRELVNNGTIPSTSRVAEVKGGRPLDAEKSVNASLGMVIDAGSLTVSADYFRIALSDRLALSQSFKLEPDEADRLIAEGITSAKNLANFRFFTNQFNTRTQGVDLVASFVPPGMGGDTEFSLAINHTATTVTSYNPAVLDEVRIRQLEDALPGTRWTTSARRMWGDLSLLGRLSYYAGWFDSRDDRDYPGEHLIDLEATYAVSESATITVGSQNALNQYPEENPNAASVAGNRYSPATPFGASGGFVYVKMGFSW